MLQSNKAKDSLIVEFGTYWVDFLNHAFFKRQNKVFTVAGTRKEAPAYRSQSINDWNPLITGDPGGSILNSPSIVSTSGNNQWQRLLSSQMLVNELSV